MSFTIPTRVGIESVRISRYTGLGSLSLTVRFTANTKEARVTVRLRLGSRTVWSKTETDVFGDLLSPTCPGHAGRGLVQHVSRKSFSVQHGLQLRDSFGVPPGGRNDDIGAASRHDLIEGLDARGV